MDLIKPYVITIVGAESSGKTTLAEQLATQFKGRLVLEYAREFLSALGRSYNENDLQMIAEKEYERINHAIKTESEVSVGEREKLKEELMHSSADSVNKMLIELIPSDRNLVIIDGGMLTMRMWSRIKFNLNIPVVDEEMENDLTDLYLLCKPRKEWQPDPLREAPDISQRVWIYNQYLREIMRIKKAYRIVIV